MAPRLNVRVREIMYQLSPYQQDVILQTFKNAPTTAFEFVKEKGFGILTATTLYFGAVWWTENELEKEKQAARF